MRNIFRVLFARRARLDSGHRITEVKPVRPLHHASASRWLALALQRAMQRGLWERAARIVQSANRLAPDYPHLSEQLARYHFARDGYEEAIRVIDRCHLRTASMRLLRNICLMLEGRGLEAHHDLLRWSRKATTPLQARLILALLEARESEFDAARKWLKMNLRQMEDPATLAVLITICIMQGQDEQARQWAERLQAIGPWTEGPLPCDLFLKSLRLSRPAPAQEASQEQVQTLVMELLACEEIIPVLVEAQGLRFDLRSAKLLEAGLEMALPELEKPHVAHEALARLALIEENIASARHWASTGLELQPMSAALTRIMQRLDKDQHAQALQKAGDIIATIGSDRLDENREVAA